VRASHPPRASTSAQLPLFLPSLPVLHQPPPGLKLQALLPVPRSKEPMWK
jgi:hypothetical protein